MTLFRFCCISQKEQLIKELKEELCGDQECELTTDLPECVDDGHPNEISNASYYTVFKRDTQSKPLKKAKNPGKIEIYVKISKNLGMWRPNTTKSENVKKVKEELKRVNSSERLKKRLRNMNVDLTVLKLDEMVTCKPGSVSKQLVCGELKFQAALQFLINILSVQCNRGTYHDAHQNLCLSCPLGTYNSLIAQTSCEKCPDFFSTRRSGSRQETECRQLCPPGTYAKIKTPKKTNSAVKTLMPFCRSCGIGEYQPEYDQTKCIKCPNSMTSDRGSKTIESCYDRNEKSCNETTCSEHGRCLPSGVFYTCECDEGFYGQKCELKQDLCATTPCYNDASCKHLNETDVQCICLDGFNGAFCENINDPCSQKNCQNGAVCTEIDGEASCDCLPGFEGDNCDRQIPMDFCETSPCASDATCVNLIDGFECICGNGAIGKRCHLAACDYKPCPENSICVNLNVVLATKESY